MKRLFPMLLLVFSVGVGAETIEWKGGTYVDEVVNGGFFKLFSDDIPHGQGTWTHPIGTKYVGEWKDGKSWKGTKYDKEGDVTATYSEGVKKAVN